MRSPSSSMPKFAVGAILVLACGRSISAPSHPGDTAAGGVGGAFDTGGRPGTGGVGQGGAPGTGDRIDANGIALTGGAISVTGGATAAGGTYVTGTGGTMAFGGTSEPSGGAGAGGATASGGNPGTGGTISSGGMTGSGGVAGSLAWPPKFFGNTDTRGAARTDFATYWDQFTPENAGKWASVQSTLATFKWTTLDAMYKYCEDNNIAFKENCFVWGAGQPSWLNNDNAAQLVQSWMKAFCDRYPKTKVIDVVNEPLHTPPTYKQGLGGAGTSGWDWIVNSFKWAHEACPNAILVLNDYNIIEYANDHTRIIDLIKGSLAAGAPIMAIGAQAHDVSKVSLSTVQTYLADLVSQTGLPVYITEMDLGIADDAQQATMMKDLVTAFWSDPNVPGITYWGYIAGATWRANTELITSAGTPRPAMAWLMDFLHR